MSKPSSSVVEITRDTTKQDGLEYLENNNHNTTINNKDISHSLLSLSGEKQHNPECRPNRLSDNSGHQKLEAPQKDDSSLNGGECNDITDGQRFVSSCFWYPNTNCSQIELPSSAVPVYNESQIGEEDVDVGLDSVEECKSYNMDHNTRGIFIILNNKTFENTEVRERHGTDVDAANIFYTFKGLGFNVYLYSNKKRDEMLSILRTAAKLKHQNSDCFGCAILSHGNEEGIYGTDRILSVEEITEPFRGHNCPQLLGKPKLFFIQACRGLKFDPGADVPDGPAMELDLDNNLPQLRRIPTEADFLFAYSTAPGYFSWRHSAKGSWFVQALCRVLKQHAADREIMWMLTQVNRTVAFEFESSACQPFMRRKKQVPSIVSMLTAELYFTPTTQPLETIV